MKKSNLFLDVHAIQTLPPSNINRDDTGSPKTAQYGGVRRARVSSQAWKKAMRDYFKENSESLNVGVRTLNIVDYLARKIREIDSSISYEEAMKLAEKTINDAGVKTANQKAKALFFLGNTQAERLAKASLEKEDKKVLKDILKENPAIDIALFGRMVADDSNLNEEASSQVAHAISTHPIDQEFDFYTAIDDFSNDQSNVGAGMLGTIEFNSSTLYRYANVAVHDLFKQLKDKKATINTLQLFVEAFVKSLPTGKVNTFANQTLPQLVLVTLREDRPVNLVSAFEKPVRSTDGYVEKSIEKLFDEYYKVEKFTQKPIFASYVTTENTKSDIKEEESLTKLLEGLKTEIDEKLEEDGE
ncbi:MAG: type I-E CRISPR-associated protein Cas7/Cse4/CasC [Peptoniphilaceae bacterium]|nr:type I-E CRISPR-associated protein Cas7/Cse4/CasC [Peptoniphilaceae bacterium]MDY6019200.1 type I-E CRISPR-associated protein Cas7/Cse4/CasC [Anaerococcus sp.]